MIDPHEPKGRIDLMIDHGQAQSIAFGDPVPVVYAGAAQRIDADVDAGVMDRREIEHQR